MAEDRYYADQTVAAAERERLGLLERVEDAPSQRHLAALGIQGGWQCLEVGAGHGSIAHWLAEQVGPQGRVVATDINPRLLTDLALPNIEVRRHDIRTDPLEAGLYDLAHCRSVLMHMREPHAVVRRMVAALRSGGWLVVEESDVFSMRTVDVHHPLTESFNRQSREIPERIAHAKLFDPYFGRRVRDLLEDAGLTEVGNEGRNHLARGGEAEARMLCLALQVFVERGILSPAECAEHQRALLDPSFSFITQTRFAAWGKRTS
jgi:SAM-dependent methyltransferase